MIMLISGVIEVRLKAGLIFAACLFVSFIYLWINEENAIISGIYRVNRVVECTG